MGAALRTNGSYDKILGIRLAISADESTAYFFCSDGS